MISIEKINKTYDAGDTVVTALSDITINFREKEFVSILGPSGCGKTTLLNILGGLDRYDSGDIKINGVSTKLYKDKDWDAYRNYYVGFVFQSYNLIPHLSVLENVEIALSIGGISKSEKRKRSIKALTEVGLEKQLNKKPNQLSGGQAQRVAIARAIVNNPEIILADEPTGALDSETSVQIMNILKEISKNHLIIMVTHNEEIASKYSTRTIKLLDGKITDDSNPPKSIKPKQINRNEKIKSSMSIFTAFALSFKNLITKKAKTLLTSFAGSIGIIGIALVLAVSSGMTNYVNNLQRDALSGYPVAISTVTINFDGISELMANGAQIDENENSLNIYDIQLVVGKLGHYNYLNEDFIEYITDYIDTDAEKSAQNRELSSTKIEQSMQLNLYTLKSGNVVKVDTSVKTSSFTGITTSNFFQGLSNKDYVLSNYTMVAGSYPQNKNEMCLVIDSNNRFSKQTLDALGIDYVQTETGFEEVTYEDILNKEYKLVLNNEYYIPDDLENPTSFTTAETSTELFNNSNNEALKISGVMKINDDATTEIFSAGIMYMPELTEFYQTNSRNSLIAQKSIQNQKLYVPYTVDVSELQSYLGVSEPVLQYTSPEQIMAYVQGYYNLTMTKAEAVELGLQMISASTIPSGIYLYSKSFDAKTNIINYINAWNESEEGQNNKIIYTDSTSFLTSTLGTLIDIISYVLIAFAGISLVVSSIMIGIITYTSVIERTKEIGVLRSIGARKKDISRVFNMETFIIGLTAGVMGVGVTWILTFPISSIIKSLAGSAVTTNLAVLNPLHAFLLIVISVALTLIAGLFPARLAAKKDPVKALRSE